MSDPRRIKEKLNPHINRVLTVAEAILPPANFPAFRKIILDEFGVNGFETELEELCRSESGERGSAWNGMGRSKSGMKGG